MNELKKCPFCGEDDMDLIGLKNHLQNHCDKFHEIEDIPCMFSRNARPDSEWVDVREHRPKEGQPCLCYFDGGFMVVAKYKSIFSKLKFIANAIVVSPSHWQPTPPDPKGKS